MRLPFRQDDEPTPWQKMNRHLALVEEKARRREAIHRGVERFMKEQAEQRQKEAETKQAAIEAAKSEQERICSEYGMNQQPNEAEGEITNG